MDQEQIPWRNDPEPDPTPEPKKLTIDLYSWWTNKNYDRFFAIIEKIPNPKAFGTAGVKMLEFGDTNPNYHAIEDFLALVEKGSLIEVKPFDQDIQKRIKTESTFLNALFNRKLAEGKATNSWLRS